MLHGHEHPRIGAARPPGGVCDLIHTCRRPAGRSGVDLPYHGVQGALQRRGATERSDFP
ncbi:hypothetical protein BBSC_1205 [Bifidobacterium scardovii JCM 12489 = DSM 13734]|nr:hypothetical protein BBSC_1205 [Bifidobacterium scardovii JCM 12489 = DSM 13734]